MGSAAIGALIGCAFGGVWGVAGATGLARSARVPASIASIAITLAIGIAIATLPVRRSAAPGDFDGAIYGIAVAFEIVAIVVASRLLRGRRPDLIVPAIACIVGLHFLGLWRATGDRLFVWTAIGTCAAGFVAMFVPAPSDGGAAARRRAIAGFGSAAVLWCAALSAFG